MLPQAADFADVAPVTGHRATVDGVNRVALGLCCLGGVLLWFATDRIILLILGVLLGLALGIGLSSQKPK